MRGRRRIGKSRLIEEFVKKNGLKSWVFSGVLPVEGTTHQGQLDEFTNQMQRNGLPPIQARDWGDVFWSLAKFAEKGQICIVLDEISWMGTKDPDFLGKLKNAWDLHFKKNPELILILCGSVSSWIEQEILTSRAFFGRISLKMKLEELSLPECNEFWESHISAIDKFKLLSVTGGVPRYLEEINTSITAEDNIHQLCFHPSGLLFDEFQQIFSDLFGRKSQNYAKIVQNLVSSSKSLNSLYKDLCVQKSGKTSAYLDDLISAGFVKRDYTWSLKTGKRSSLSTYRLSDNYLRFYIKYILPKKHLIESGHCKQKPLPSFMDWSAVMGLQFENLVLNNAHEILKYLKILPQNIAWDGPYFQRGSKQKRGVQIDYLIQTEQSFLYVCEIKFSKRTIGKQVIKEVASKIQNLDAPKNISILPVLIHIGPISDEVQDSNFFVQTIDFGKLLQPA